MSTDSRARGRGKGGETLTWSALNNRSLAKNGEQGEGDEGQDLETHDGMQK